MNFGLSGGNGKRKPVGEWSEEKYPILSLTGEAKLLEGSNPSSTPIKNQHAAQQGVYFGYR